MKYKKTTLAAIPVILAVGVLAAVALTASRDARPIFGRGSSDEPPTIEFTWSPAGAVSLMEMKAKLHLKDDHELDFPSYKMTLVEAGRELRLPLADEIIGKEYEDTLSFSLIADDPQLYGEEKLTVQIEIADDRGQKTAIEKVIKLKPPMLDLQLEAR